MNKEQAYNEFWNSFGMSAYEQSTVGAETVFPYITYELATGDYDEPVALSVSIWDRNTSWKRITEASRNIEKRIIESAGIKTEDGYIYICKGSPYAQRMSDEDSTIRRIVLNVEVHFLNN